MTTRARPDGRRLIAAAVLTTLALVLGGCAAAGGSAPDADPVATSEVDVADDVFEPAAIEVTAGTEVTWTWVGSNAHNVTADGFSSETQTTGTFRHTFSEPGTYEYRCTLHPRMTGTVLVTEPASDDAT